MRKNICNKKQTGIGFRDTPNPLHEFVRFLWNDVRFYLFSLSFFRAIFLLDFFYYSQQFRQLISGFFYRFRCLCTWYTWLACFFVISQVFNFCHAEALTFTRAPDISFKLGNFDSKRNIVFYKHVKNEAKGMVVAPSKLMDHTAKMFNKLKLGSVFLGVSREVISNYTSGNSSKNCEESGNDDIGNFFHILILQIISGLTGLVIGSIIVIILCKTIFRF